MPADDAVEESAADGDRAPPLRLTERVGEGPTAPGQRAEADDLPAAGETLPGADLGADLGADMPDDAEVRGPGAGDASAAEAEGGGGALGADTSGAPDSA